ncbi:mitochondrial carrier [Hanseniaspora valbyensis NRRL Y-1626]|uniref:Mitochondrial carrier n=1 Tax=Hanseniaspora valbyensis NRRL Y-1626 TaxID=766949 RepID=A0A1B7TGD8_9ASCO|nr:mitochondrial carrier [Hanseniaspora valbyensis NRRL Y-1626]
MEHAISGSISGVVSISLTYPLVTLSTLLQARKSLREDETLENRQNIIKQLHYLYKKGDLYNGLSSCVSGIAATNFVYYYFFEKLSSLRLKYTRRHKLTFGESTIIGFIAGSITATATNPIWNANTRLITASKEKNADGSVTSDSSLIKMIFEIANTEGISALFKGLKPALVLVLNPVIQYSIFEQLKNLIYVSRDDITPNMSFVLGALSKIVATVITYPTITIKTQSHLQENQSMIDMFKKIIKEDGVLGMFKGLQSKIIQSVLTSAFLFYFKQRILDLIKMVIKLRKQNRLKVQ